MKDTSFSLTEEQLPRLATSYRRTDKDELETAQISILYGKTATSRDRFPAANGGLFSTAPDYARFCRMILNGGELDGKRYVKPESVALMTGVQTGDLKTGFTPGNGWGLGWCVTREPQGLTAMLSPGTFGHGGAYGTQAWIDPVKKRITILMVQRANFPNSDASEVRRAFQEAANSSLESEERQSPYPKCVRIFDGKTFDGWEADPSTWSITDGAMRGFAGSSRLAYTKADYGNFRLIFTSRMDPVNGDHLGVLFWGDRPKDPAKPKIDNAGWLQFMPPFGGMWDYHLPMHHDSAAARDDHEGTRESDRMAHDGAALQPREGDRACGGRWRRDRPLPAQRPWRARRSREANRGGPHRDVPPRSGRVGIQRDLPGFRPGGRPTDHRPVAADPQW